MATSKITTNLFSFKTFRSPDKINFHEKEVFFIHHPDFTKSKLNNSPLPDAKDTSDKRLLEFINGLKPAKSYKEIKAINPELYYFSCLLMQQLKNDSTKKQFKPKLPSTLKNDVLLKIWDELFIQILTQKSNTTRQACIQLIIANFYLQNNKTLELKDISRLTVIIPDTIIERFRLWRYAKCGGKLFGVYNLGIQEYRRVEQTLCCYVPGEVSHIENIMAREYKEKSTRNLLRTEETSEFTSETEIENLNDTTTTERNEISSEAAKELQKDKSFDISGSVTVSKDTKIFGSITANVSSGYNSSSSSSQSNTEAKNYAKEITERALERVVQKTTEKRTYKMIKEFEENSKHGFDNREGNQHVTGVYRWVDKIYDNQLVNYGRRLLFELSIPSPSEFYKKAILWKNKKGTTQQNTLVPPKTLAEFGITDVSSVNNENVQLASNYFGLNIESYKVEEQYLDVSYSANTEHHHGTKTDVQNSIIIPTGFVADRIDGFGSFEHRASSGPKSYLRLIFGGKDIFRGEYNAGSRRADNFNINIDFNPDIEGVIAFAISYRKVFRYSGSFKVRCVSNPELFTEWQSETLATLQDAYQTKLDKYNEELKLQQAAEQAQSDQEDNQFYTNPAMNRLIEERELKRICIEMMSKPYCYEMGKRFYECKTYECKSECDEVTNQVTEVIQNEALEKYATFIKFFETAFHWEIFSYIFYPYYYNSKCQWSQLLQTQNDDPIFEAFLQSGMAKVLVPIRPQYEKAVMWYLETGEIYTDENLVPEIEDDRYLSLLSELQNQDEIKVEGTWQTRVPSALTIIQSKSTYLEDEKGLPCCEDEEKLFASDDRLLERLKSE
ncbi:MAG: hypothetical protein MUC49_22510 [Raineya sp.]|jgi:hypothetical protein|nr:hypothetical protein [Raineya sp.]